MAGKVWDWISNKTRRFVEDIGNKLRGLATKMTTIWGNIKTSAHQKWNAIWSTVSGFAERIKNAIVDKFTSAKNTVVDVFNGMRDAIRSVLNNIISVVNGAISKVNGVVSAIESAFSFGPSLIVDSFYRDGNGEIAQSQKGWWKLEKSTDNGVTWATLTVSQTAALDRLKINVNGLSLKAHDMLKVSLYFDQSKTKLADYQTYSVAVDVASLTQEQIVDILSDDGKFKGLYYEKDESGNTTLYISFNAMKGGVISLGGTNNGNGQLKIYDDDGNQISRLGYTGYVVLNKNTGKPMVSLNTAGLRLYTYYTDAKNYKALMLGKYGLYAQDVSDDAIRLWQEGTGGGYIVKYQNDTVWIYTDNLTAMNNVTIGGTLMFYDLENQTKTSGKVKRQPVASVSADNSQVAYLSSGTGSKHGETIVHRRLGIRAKWGGAGFSTDYLYTDGQVSDIRLKENIENSETDALETVNRMKVRQFDWKERMGGWHQNIGFVADELEEIDPNLALGGGYDENGEMDIKQINSPYLLNYAIKAIQELSAKVEAQEKRIKELERKLQDGKI